MVEWTVEGPEHYESATWYTVVEWKGGYRDGYMGSTVQIKCLEPTSETDDGEPVWETERELAHFIAQHLNDNEREAEQEQYEGYTPEEEARINEMEMWGPSGRPGR